MWLALTDLYHNSADKKTGVGELFLDGYMLLADDMAVIVEVAIII